MARFARGGLVWVSTGISSQNIYYYNYSDIVIFWERWNIIVGSEIIKLIF